jgi:hypothetical protein
VAGHTRVILFSPGILLRAKDDDLLKQAFSDMKRRNIDFAVELGLLTRTDKCQAKFEGYLDDIETVRRIVDRISRSRERPRNFTQRIVSRRPRHG